MKEISDVWRTRGFEAFHGRRRKFYTSESFELPPGAAVPRIAWDAELAPKTWVRARMRCADTLPIWIGHSGPVRTAATAGLITASRSTRRGRPDGGCNTAWPWAPRAAATRRV